MLANLRSVARDTLTDTVKKIHEAETATAASALSYATILSLIPLIAVSFSVFKAFGGVDRIYGIMEPFLFENLAEGADARTLKFVHAFVESIHARTLGIGASLGLLVTSMAMLARIEHTINKIWQTPIKKSFLHRITIYWILIILGPLALAGALGAATAVDMPMQKFLPRGIPFFFILLAIFFGMYKYVPHRRVHWKAALIAASGTTLCWVLTKAIYGVYIHKVLTYNKIYGSLVSVPIFLIWIYVAWLVTLSGAAFSASLQSHFLTKDDPPSQPPHGNNPAHEKA